MKNIQLQTIIRLFNYAKKYRKGIGIATFYSFMFTAFDILPEVLIGLAIDVIVYQHHSLLARFGINDVYYQLIVLGGLTFIVCVFESAFEYLYSVKWRNLAQALQHQLRIDTYTHIQDADMHYFENINSGNLVSIMNDDINQLERFFDNGINMIIHIIASTLLVGGIFFILAPKVALLALIPIPFILYGAYYFQHLIGPQYDKVRATAGELNNRFTNNMLGIATIKSYAAEEYERHSLGEQSLEYQKANARAIRLSAAITPIVRMAIMVGFLATLVYGGWLTLQGQLAISAYSILVFLSQRLLWPLTYLAEVTDQFYRAMASINRILNLLTVPIHITSGAHVPDDSTAINGEIAFKNVSFTYANEKKPLINNLNLVIPAGHTVGFVGGTGTGKSTLVKLLLRFYDPSIGQIQLDNKNLKEYDLDALRRHIGYVSQDVFLFNGTVADNIAYGTFSASKDEIEHAARLARAHDFILTMPQGYQTRIGERGVKLSGGQKQRLSIARALLKDPTILILDEATSAVDNETEAAIQESLSKIIEDRTTIIIAHRLNTVRHVDTIYVLENGQISEQGDHDSLLAADGLYAWLWQLQTGAIY
jgi:ATP-binding cassette, subfamily B, bacterial